MLPRNTYLDALSRIERGSTSFPIDFAHLLDTQGMHPHAFCSELMRIVNEKNPKIIHIQGIEHLILKIITTNPAYVPQILAYVETLLDFALALPVSNTYICIASLPPEYQQYFRDRFAHINLRRQRCIVYDVDYQRSQVEENFKIFTELLKFPKNDKALLELWQFNKALRAFIKNLDEDQLFDLLINASINTYDSLFFAPFAMSLKKPVAIPVLRRAIKCLTETAIPALHKPAKIGTLKYCLSCLEKEDQPAFQSDVEQTSYAKILKQTSPSLAMETRKRKRSDEEAKQNEDLLSEEDTPPKRRRLPVAPQDSQLAMDGDDAIAKHTRSATKRKIKAEPMEVKAEPIEAALPIPGTPIPEGFFEDDAALPVAVVQRPLTPMPVGLFDDEAAMPMQRQDDATAPSSTAEPAPSSAFEAPVYYDSFKGIMIEREEKKTATPSVHDFFSLPYPEYDEYDEYDAQLVDLVPEDEDKFVLSNQNFHSMH